MNERLGADDWLAAGLRALARQGPQAVRAEALARDLGVTKGSFYWHFKDMPDFRSKLMTFWRALAYDRFVAAVEGMTSEAALRRLGHMAVTCGDPAVGGPGMEPALRGWAMAEADVAAEVVRVDALRRARITSLAGACNIGPAAAQALYAAMLGLGQQRDLTDDQRIACLDALLDGLLAERVG